ncbi:hypothetical protein L1987_29979 [Smallanthus sonchifolius]|uniref:Uncharacterized protein n=1 Tax=Smallanthus sonchifolius TaxID=185202 RepID=A0ACB9I1E0_9ASTR|nr:hypothetical protein L1987_29979 [Smallanthus sonchifolius]
MSSGSGTPTGGGYMRQRYSHGYASSGDDLEDDASSILQLQSPDFPTTRTLIENVVWIVSAVFIVYLGDCHSNLIYLLFHDDRIRRLQMYLGLCGIVLNVVYVLCTGVLGLDVRKSSECLEMLTTYGLTFVTILGLVSFCFALWPIWSFFTIPLVFTLLMASMVILSCLVIKQQPSSSGSHKRVEGSPDHIS